MNHIARLLVPAVLFLAYTTLSAQNTLRPRPMNQQFDATHMPPPLLPLMQELADPTIFRHNINKFRFAGQWGNSEFAKANKALSHNLNNGGWSYFDMTKVLEPTSTADDTANYSHKLALHDLDANVDNYLGWQMSWGFYDSVDIHKQWFRSWIGMRWEPAEDWHIGDAWTPRDSSAWPYGFEVRHVSGTTTNDTANANYRRFVLDPSRFSGTMPVKVLDSCNPRISLYTTTKDNYRGGEAGHTDSTDGRRMILSINLRRVDPLDVLIDDTPVLRLKVRGNRFEPKPTDHARLKDPVHFIFDSIPDPSGAFYELREGRGKVLRMIDPPLPNDTTDEMIITRRMLPTGTDRDITITAEFRSDSTFFYNPDDDQWDSINARLKVVEFMGHGLIGKQAMFIDTMTPVVEYYDTQALAIQSVSIVARHTFYVLAGAYDSAFALILDTAMLKIHDAQDYYHDSCRYGAGNILRTKNLYIEHIYGPDEFGTRDDLGMYYRTHLLNGFCNSETGYEGPYGYNNYTVSDARKRMHMLPFAFYWTSGLGFTGMMTPSPMLPYSDYLLVESPFKTLSIRDGYRFGQSTIDNAEFSRPYAASYETIGQTNIVLPAFYDTFGVPLADSLNTDSIYERIMTPNVTVGVMGSWEKSLYIHFYKNNWFFTKPTTPWISHGFYHYRTDMGWTSDSTVSYIHFNSWRPQSGEEVRLELSTALAFGAKGFAYDKIKDLPGREHLIPDSVKNSNGSHANASHHIEPGMMMYMSRTDWDSIPGVDSSNILASDSLGGDYLPPNDPWHFGQFQSRDTIANAMQLSRCFGNDSTDRIYLGQKSIRCEMKKWHDLIMDARYNDVMFRMKPISWYGQGYRKLIKGNMADLNYWIDTTKSTMKMLQWTKDSARATTYDVRSEPVDERFYDYVLLDLAPGTAAVRDSCILAVINRRTAPGIIDSNRVDSIELLSTYDFDQRVLSQPEYRYRQLGARRIVIPFEFDQGSSTAWNLRVNELSLDDLTRIDTVMGASSELAVDFKPGQTRFFKITRVAASEQSGKGFLSHSNQRKFIAFPKVDTLVTVEDTVDGREYLRIVVGDSMYYHQVYHRRRPTELPPTGEGGALSVYYRRSLPIRTPEATALATHYVFDASTVVWEPEQLISNHILYDVPGGEEELVDMDLSCGYPALVVRPAQTDTGITAQVYVVFGCEYSRTTPLDTVLVCETVLPAETSRTAQVDYYTANPSRVLDVTPAPIAPILEHWGTPMVNASQHGNFYCWAHATGGIGAGFKVPTARVFAAGQAMYIKARGGMTDTWYETHPSLNSYSRLNIGEEDCALVWQEGVNPDEGPFIFYTRLRHGAGPGYAIANYMTTTDPYYTATGATFTDTYNAGNDIGMVTDGNNVVDEDEILTVHAFPVVYRHLSDWETTPANSRHNLRLVNHKADRIYWQTRAWKTLAPWMIARRLVDISEWSHYYGGGLDFLYSMPEHFIFSTEKNLKGPDVTQGEQWGELGSVPENATANFGDSCSVLNFWSDTSATDANPNIWHMVFGWSFYGSTLDHALTDLVDDDLLQQIHGTGRYPHLAARYSVSAHRGYQRSRRFYDQPGGVWANYVASPVITTSSEYFYKKSLDNVPQGLVYNGFRDRRRSSAVGPILKQTTDEWIPFHAEAEEEMKDNIVEASPDRFVSAWLEVADVEDMTFATSESGADAAGIVYVERESDGQRTELEFLNIGRDEKLKHTTYTVLGEKGDRFRFVIEPTDDNALGVQDVEIVFPVTEGLGKSTSAFYAGLLDLRTMSGAKSVLGGVVVYPNPASDMVTIAFDLRNNSERGIQSAESAMVTIHDVHGVEVGRIEAKTVDAVHVNASTWPSGIYSVHLRSGITSHKRLFSVVH